MFICLLILWLGTFNAGAKGVFGAGEFFLDNGLRVIVIPNHRVPIVKHMLFYKTGGVDEKVGKGGVAHLLEHLMFRGTKKISGNRFNQLMEENGAESNAFTSLEMTAYHQLLDVSRLELAMFLEADRMNNLQIDKDVFVKERDIVIQERRQRVDNNPLARFREAINRTLWQNHPYYRPLIGSDEEIFSLTKNDAEEFYHQYYAPNNAVLVLSGDINIKEAKILADKYYGNLEYADVKKNKMPDLNENFKAKIEVEEPEIKSLRIIKIYATSSFMKNAEDVYPLQVLAEYMGGGESSKLYKKLVMRDKKALGVNVSYNPVMQSYGVFQVSMVPVEGIDKEDAQKLLEDAWNEALSELTTDEIEKIKSKMLAKQVYLKDNPEKMAYAVGEMAVIGMDLKDIEAQEQKTKQVRKSQIIEVIKKLETKAPQITGILKPKGNNNGKNTSFKI